jgi:hypothetical protein
MSNFDTFMAEGATTCAGSLVYRNAEVGVMRDGDLHLNEAGKAILAKFDAATDVVTKAPRAPKAKAINALPHQYDAALDDTPAE